MCWSFVAWVAVDLVRVLWRIGCDPGSAPIAAEPVAWVMSATAVVTAVAFAWQHRERRVGRQLRLFALTCGVVAAACWLDLRHRAPWAPWCVAPLLLAVFGISTRGWLRNGVRALFALGFLVAGVAGFALGSGYFWYPIPARAPEPAADRDARWQQDLDVLAAELPRLHANVFHTITPGDFAARVAAVRARIATSTDLELELALAGLVAAIGDAHTSCEPWYNRPHRRLPLSFAWFADGVHFTLVPDDRRELAGRELVAIAGVPIADLCERLRPILSHRAAAMNPGPASARRRPASRRSG